MTFPANVSHIYLLDFEAAFMPRCDLLNTAAGLYPSQASFLIMKELF